MKPSLKQISRLTGFSIATVSNALSGNRSVNADTAARIYQVAKEIGYITARKIRRVKLVAPRTTGRIFDSTPFFSILLEGISAECAACGFDMSYIPLDVNADSFADQLQKLQTDLNSAILLLGTELTGEEYRYFDSFTLPIVTVDYWCPSQRYNGVEINNYGAAYKAAAYLIDKGHRRIGYLRGEFRIRAFHERGRGLRACLFEHELPSPNLYTFTLGSGMDRAYTDMKGLLAGSPDLPTAFLADHDIIALGAIKALQESGYRVPDDISVLGFDDLPYCPISSPSLTTMHVPAAEMGRMAVRRLKELLDQSDTVITRTQVCAEVTERESVAELTRH